MCKICIIPKINDDNRENVLSFLKAIAEPLSIGQQDGLGYAGIDKNGKLFGQRWLKNSEAFQPRTVVETIKVQDSPIDVDIFQGMLELEKSSTVKEIEKVTALTGETNSFGVINLEEVTALTIHTRFATSAKGMINTHPFVREGISLIHNGVIQNHEEFELKVSTCDSEAILDSLIKNDVYNNPKNIEKVGAELIGYYAVGVLSERAIPTLDVFKDTGASLSAFFVDELQTIVFCTVKSAVEDACKKAGFTVGITAEYKVLPNRMIRFHAVTGDVIGTFKFESKRTNYGTGGGYCGYGYNYGTHNTNKTTNSFNKKDNTNRFSKYMRNKQGRVEKIESDIKLLDWEGQDEDGWYKKRTK